MQSDIGGQRCAEVGTHHVGGDEVVLVGDVVDIQIDFPVLLRVTKLQVLDQGSRRPVVAVGVLVKI
jgi:hypothetical protein